MKFSLKGVDVQNTEMVMKGSAFVNEKGVRNEQFKYEKN